MGGQSSLKKIPRPPRWLVVFQLHHSKIKRGEIDDLDPTTQKITVSAALTSYREHVLPTLAREGKGGHVVHLRRIEDRFGPLYVAALRAPVINTWARDLATVVDDLGPQSVIHHAYRDDRHHQGSVVKWPALYEHLRISRSAGYGLCSIEQTGD